jgi:hypothetical protein
VTSGEGVGVTSGFGVGVGVTSGVELGFTTGVDLPTSGVELGSTNEVELTATRVEWTNYGVEPRTTTGMKLAAAGAKLGIAEDETTEETTRYKMAEDEVTLEQTTENEAAGDEIMLGEAIGEGEVSLYSHQILVGNQFYSDIHYAHPKSVSAFTTTTHSVVTDYVLIVRAVERSIRIRRIVSLRRWCWNWDDAIYMS